MSAAIPICHDSDRESWLKARQEGIGGSDAPAILGQSRFAGPAKIAAIKLGYQVDDDSESELLKWGRLVEAPMMQALQEETGIEATVDGTMYRCQIPGREFMQATLDGTARVDHDPVGIECKLAYWTASDWDRGVPAAVNTQVQHQMAVLDLRASYVLVLLDGYRFRWSRVERDDAFIEEQLVPMETMFWEKIQAGEIVPPTMAAPDREYEALKKLFPDHVEGKIKHLEGPEWIDVHDRWKVNKAAASQAEKAAKGYRNQLIAEIGDAEFGQLDDGTRLSLRQQTRAEHVVRKSKFRVLREVSGS